MELLVKESRESKDQSAKLVVLAQEMPKMRTLRQLLTMNLL